MENLLIAEKKPIEKIEIISAERFVLLCFFSFNLYTFWWMYKSWKLFKEKENSDITPALRAIFNLLFLYSLFERIKRFAKSQGYIKNYSSGWLFFGIIFIGGITQLPDPLWVLQLFICTLFIPPMEALNFAIENSDNYRSEKLNSLTAFQIIILIIGGLGWFFLIKDFLLTP